METQPRRRGAAQCTDCGRALAVWFTADDGIRPIGSSDGCPCGGSSFRAFD